VLVKVGNGSEGGNLNLCVSNDRAEKIGGDSHSKVEGKSLQKITGDWSSTVGGECHVKSSLSIAQEAGTEMHLKAGMKLIIEAGAQLSLVGPGGFIDIGPSGVTIQGTMVNINSGGAAGSGSGCSPTDPDTAEEASPEAPAEAHDSDSGLKSCS
jgi:type VI secretion system secreted protein VgrG